MKKEKVGKIMVQPAALSAFIFTALVLSLVHVKVSLNMILIDRFVPGSAWVMIVVLSVYAAFLVTKISDPVQSAKWRKRSWTLFSIVFFGQLILGVSGFEQFLMRPDKLHLPIPAMIIAGPVYRASISFMPILFLSTILLAGPAWCSQLCYFGAIDNLVASHHNRSGKKPIKHLMLMKHTFLFLVLAGALICRYFISDFSWVLGLAVSFGVVGLGLIFFVSGPKRKMFHCVTYCPVGTLVRYLKLLNPFRMKINSSCTECMACTRTCYYDALNITDIKKRKPGPTCTLCGDCIVSCHTSSIEYKFPGLKSQSARLLWIVITVSIHAIFLGLARL